MQSFTPETTYLPKWWSDMSTPMKDFKNLNDLINCIEKTQLLIEFKLSVYITQFKPSIEI